MAGTDLSAVAPPGRWPRAVVLGAVAVAAGVVVGGVVPLVGCTTTSPARPFAEVQEEVRERTGYRVEWNRWDSGAAAIERALEDLLGRELTADAAVQVALLNNRRLQAEYGRLGVAQAELVQAGLLKNPVFHGVLRWAPGAQQVFDFSVVQDFLDVLLIPLRVATAESELDAVRHEVAGRVIDVAADTRRAYHGCIAAEQEVELRRLMLTAAEASYEMAERLGAAGNLTELEILREQAGYERAKLAVARAEMRRVRRRERLNRLMGLWGGATGWSAAAELPALPEEGVATDGVERRALAASLDLAAAYAQLEAAAQRFRVVEVMQIVPTFELGGSAELEKESTVELVERRRRDGRRYELEEIPGPTEIWSGGQFAIAIPLFDQGQAARAAGRAEIDRRYERYTALAIEIRSAAREAAFRAATAQARAAYCAAIVVRLHEAVTQETQLRYNAMFDGVFTLLESKRRELEARLEFVDAMHEFWHAHANLEQLLAGRLPPEVRAEADGGEAVREADRTGDGRAWGHVGADDE